MPDKQQFRERYAGLPDDQFQVVALSPDLLPEAREAVTEEMQARGLTEADLKAFRRQMKRDRTLARRSDYVARQQLQDFKEGMALVLLIFSAWVSAVMLPWLALVEPDRGDWRVFLVLAGLIAVSCLLGLRARKEARIFAFGLRTVMPLALLVVSTLVFALMPTQ
jgi:hypothetical protein